MVFNIKNLLKKVCLLGASATMAFGLCSSFVSAAAPGASDPGVSLDSADIGKASDVTGNTTNNGTQADGVITVDATLASTLTFDGTAKQIISSINHVYFGSVDLNITGSDSDVDLYLRIADTQDANPASGDWVKYDNSSNNNLDNAKLKRRAGGTYYVYYYIDGKNSMNDVGKGTGTGT